MRPETRTRPRQVQLARQMYDEVDDHGKRYTVGPIAAEFGVTRPTIYRYLNKTTPLPNRT
ncbi:helix-turn-helix domain-containing protein [Nocardia sp. NPDC049190]|uniref:helix-turn-helix domain-containing protein n=1 Tax=Nocardia sp. NPDC049190 TaxID=3155650 RepID=UPI0033DFD929